MSVLYPLVTFTYVSQVLGPDNLGKVTFSASIISYFTMIAALGIYSYAIKAGSGLRDDRKKISKFASEIISTNLLSMIVAYVLLFGLLFFWKNPAAELRLLLTYSLTVLLNTISFDWLYDIYEDYSYVTIRSLVVYIIGFILTFAVIKTSADYAKYALLSVIIPGIGNLINCIYSKKYIDIKLDFSNIKEHIKPIFILFFNSIMTSIYLSSNITIIGFMKGDTVTGYYKVAANIYEIIKTLLTAAVSVTIPRLTYLFNNNDEKGFKDMAENVFKFSLLLLLPAAIGLFMVSKDLILFIFTDEYFGSINSLRILSFSLIFACMACFYVNGILLPYGKEKKVLIVSTASCIVNLILNFILINRFSLEGAAIATVAAEAVVLLLSAYYSRSVFKGTLAIKNIASIVLGCLSIVGICIFVDGIIVSTLFRVIVKIILSILIYFVIVFIFDRDFIKNIKL